MISTRARSTIPEDKWGTTRSVDLRHQYGNSVAELQTQPLFEFDVLSAQRQTLQTVTRYSYGLSSFCCCSRNCHAKHRGASPTIVATYTRTLPLWLRYVDDTFTAVHKDGINDFHEHLNRQNADIQFTKEIEENGKIPFLDCLVTPDNNKLKTTIYRKPTHTDRLLDQSSYNPTSHKATIRTLTRRAQQLLVCDSPDSLQDETDYLNNVF